MSTIKSSDEHLTLNADGTSKDIKLQSNASEKVIIKSDGKVGIGISTPTNPLTVEGDGARIAFSNTATYPCLAGISAFRSGTSHGNMYIETAGGSNFNTPAERIAIEGTTGEVKISTGDLIFGTAGKGIVLGNTSNADANTLDDYEEGTWTPVLTDLTNNATMHSLSAGVYTKIGRVVHCTANVRTTSLGSVSGNLYLSGFPFSTPNQNGNHGAGSVANAENMSITAGHAITLYYGKNSNSARFDIYDHSGGVTVLQASEWTSDGQATIQVTYST